MKLASVKRGSCCDGGGRKSETRIHVTEQQTMIFIDVVAQIVMIDFRRVSRSTVLYRRQKGQQNVSYILTQPS